MSDQETTQQRPEDFPREGLDYYLAEAEGVQTAVGRWRIIRSAWGTYRQYGAGVFDWDYDSRNLMRALMRFEDG